MYSAVINTCDWGSTGKIAKGLCDYLRKKGSEVLFCYGRGAKRNDNECFRFDNTLDVYLHYADTHLTGRLNAASIMATKRLIARLRQLSVKEVYLLNLHGHILNENLFLNYLVKDNIHVVYIMADESAFLGNCTYRLGCEEYKQGCVDCRDIKGLAKLICPNASKNAFATKKDAYSKIKYISFVAPGFVIESAKTSPLMQGKRMEIVDEAIDVRVNTPKDTTALRMDLGIKDEQIVIVCVAPFSYPRKGVKYFVEAAKRLEGDERFVFVQVGYDAKDKSGLPKNYIPIGYVNGQEVLTQYYSLADLFVFPSIQDTMPNACLEALACGSPLLCFNTSGMPYIADETVMTLVEARNVEQMVEVVKTTKKKTQATIDTCRNYALERYDNQKYFERLKSIMDKMKEDYMIPFNKPYCSGRELKYIEQVCHSTTMSGNGEFTKKCHHFFEEKYGFKKVLLCTSGTDALEMCAMLCDLKPGDEVIVPSYTFVSTALAFLREGAKVVFADSGKDNPNITLADIEPLVTPRTKVIAVVHYAGVACDMDAIMQFANERGLLVVEDAAHSIDSYYKDRPLGGIGHLGAFSFHETKNISSGEGGMLVVNDERFIRRAEILWEKGTNRAEFYRGMVNKYGWCDMGSSFLPSEFNAAYLWAQLEQLEDIQGKRLAIWNTYDKALRGHLNNGIVLPELPEYATNNSHMYYLLCPSLEYRTAFMNYLKENGVMPTFHYLPLHSSAYYHDKHDGRELPNCDRYGDTLVRLPLYYELSLEDAEKISRMIVGYSYTAEAQKPRGGGYKWLRDKSLECIVIVCIRQTNDYFSGVYQPEIERAERRAA